MPEETKGNSCGRLARPGRNRRPASASASGTRGATPLRGSRSAGHRGTRGSPGTGENTPCLAAGPRAPAARRWSLQPRKCSSQARAISSCRSSMICFSSDNCLSVSREVPPSNLLPLFYAPLGVSPIQTNGYCGRLGVRPRNGYNGAVAAESHGSRGRDNESPPPSTRESSRPWGVAKSLALRPVRLQEKCLNTNTR